jgi:hypothetical protein
VTASTASAGPAAAPPMPQRRAKGLLIGIGIGLLVTLGAYGFGRFQGLRATNQAEQRVGAAEQKAAGLETALASKQADLLRFEARRKLHLASIALDDRNFGIAQQHVAAAGRLLTKSGTAGGLAMELSNAKLVVTEDVGVQRGRVLAWARKLDAALPAIEP